LVGLFVSVKSFFTENDVVVVSVGFREAIARSVSFSVHR
jgi:hypothetical protein